MVSALAACSDIGLGDQKPTVAEAGRCGNGIACNVGLVCLDQLCQVPGGAAQATTAASSDSGSASSSPDGGGSSGGTTHTWQAGSLTVHDSGAKLAWMLGIPDGVMTWSSAGVWCASQQLGGGWRLPTLPELRGLVVGSACPTINTAVFPNTPCAPFWTSTLAGDNKSVPVIDFTSGTEFAGDPGYYYRVRCVRASP